MKGSSAVLIVCVGMSSLDIIFVYYRRSHWFHTIMVTRAELDRTFNNVAMKNR